MFDFPTAPATGTVVTVPDGSYRVWDSQKWRASPSASVIIPPGGTGSYSVQAFGAVGDGITDDASAIQNAINAAAGRAPLRFPASQVTGVPAVTYLIGSALIIPSNTRLIIEAGATIKIANGANCSCLEIIANASNILTELYGTLDGNASNQPVTGSPSGGITGQGNVPFSDTLIWGGRSGVITNFKTWPINFTMVTNVEVNGVTITNCGSSPGMAGITTRVNVVTGSYTTSSGAVTLNTGTNPHGIHVGDTFTYVAASGAAAQVQGEYVALTVPDAFTVTAQAVAGLVGGNPSLTTGRVGTCIKSYNSGFVNCTVRNIRDIGLCLYGGVVGGYIRGCDVDAGPLIYSDAGQPGSNIDCEISGCYTHDASFGGPAVVSQQFGISQHNCRVYDNIVRNMARGGIILGYCDGVEVYGNSLHNNAPDFSGASQQSGQINVGNGTVRANIWGNTVRDPGPSATAQQVISVTGMTYVSATGATTLTLASAPTSPINVGDKFIVFNVLGFVAPDGTSTSYLQLNGSWTAAAGTTGSTVVYTAPSGLGTITLLGAAVIATTLAVTSHIAAGNYSSDISGNMSLTTTAPHNLTVGDAFVLASILGNTTAGNISAAALVGLQVATAGTSGTTLNFVTAPSLASFAVTSGNVWPANFGISIDVPDYCRIAGNRIGDYQKPGVMTACIGGTWGLNGASEGNYFGPRNQPDPDVSLYGSGVNGFNYDLLLGTTLANNTIDGQVTFRGVTQASNPQSAYYPPLGLTPGWNRSPMPHGEVDFFLGEGPGSTGGFDFLQVAVIKTVASPVGPPIPYDPATGIVTLTTNTAHGILLGGSFVLSGITGTDGNSGRDVVRLNGSHVANSDTTGTTLTYTMVAGLTVISTAAGATVVPSGGGGGVLKTSVGIGGSLLAGDGYGNTRFGGALVHGAMQTAALVNAGTITVNANTSFVLIQNSASIATASVVLPAPAAFQFSAGAELELNFQNPIGALTVTAAVGASVVNPPTAVASAGMSANFINIGTIWTRRIAM